MTENTGKWLKTWNVLNNGINLGKLARNGCQQLEGGGNGFTGDGNGWKLKETA